MLDSNIVLSVLVPDEHTPLAIKLFERVDQQGIRFEAPFLLTNEVAHVLLRLHRLKRISAQTAHLAYARAKAYDFLQAHDLPLNRSDFDLGLRSNIGGSDLFFVRLARELDCPLVTMDKALRTNTAGVVEALALEGALERLGV